MYGHTLLQNTPFMAGLNGMEPEAKNFIQRCQDNGSILLNEMQKSSLQFLYYWLKQSKIYEKLDIFYPIIGGNANSHKTEGKTQSVYEITWNGTLIHNSKGTTGDGATGYGDTNWTYSGGVKYLRNDGGFGTYMRKNIDGGEVSTGATDGANQGNIIFPRTGGSFQGRVNAPAVNGIYATSDSLGWFDIARTASNLTITYKNGVEIGSIATASIAKLNLNAFLLARNNNGGGANGFSSNTISFASFGQGTNIDRRLYFWIIETYQWLNNRSTIWF